MENRWGRRARSGQGLGIRARLLGLVLIPTVGLIGIGVDSVDEHRRLADEAGELAAGVDAAAMALEAFVVTTREFRLAEIIVQARDFGMSPQAAGDLLGLDVAGEMAAARRDVDADALVPQLLPDRDTMAALARERDGVDGGVVEQALLPRLVAAAQQRWLDETERLSREYVDTPVQGELRRALDALVSSADLYEAASQRILMVAKAIVPAMANPIASSDDVAVVGTRYQAALERVAREADADLRPAVIAVEGSDEFETALAALGEIDDPVANLDELAEMFRLGLEHDELVQSLVTVASADARDHALSVGEAAQGAYRRTLVALVALVLGSVTVALAVAASIGRPLRRLAERAADLSDGELDGPPLPAGGPRETAVLATALNDAVHNLAAVEQRMAALAAGDLAVAARTAPGKLGDLVGRSVDSLAVSLAEREGLQRRLAHEAAHDPLTGLANRRTAVSELDSMLDAGARVALLFLDLDGFKMVNDEFGHAVGDKLLVVAARRLERAADDGALVARFGGDEFVVAAVVGSDDEAQAIGQRIVDVFDEPLSVEGLPHRLGTSVGVAVSSVGGDADQLLRLADAALYEAKRAGRGGLVALDARLQAQIDEQHRIEAALRVAVAEDQLEVHYQPVFRAAGGIHGVEALVRWPQADGTLMPPDDFVPAAERSGLVNDLDRWVLGRALQQLRTWRDGALPHLRLSVNVSSKTLLSRSFVADVVDALRHSGVDGSALVVEVTETALLTDLDTAADRITELLTFGVRTSVDDYGTGYTSVSHLRRLPVSEVKIDRSFVAAMGSDERDRELVGLMARIGIALGLDVVAEGVETGEQLDALLLLGCHFAQGYHLGRPVPAGALEATHGVVSSPAVTG